MTRWLPDNSRACATHSQLLLYKSNTWTGLMSVESYELGRTKRGDKHTLASTSAGRSAEGAHCIACAPSSTIDLGN